MIRSLCHKQALFTSFRGFATVGLTSTPATAAAPPYRLAGLVTPRRVAAAFGLTGAVYVAASVRTVDDARLLWLIPTRLARDVWTAGATIAGEIPDQL